MKTNNNFDTIGLIISLILSDSFIASVKSLAEACDLPVQQMRKYLSVIFNNKNLLTHLSKKFECPILHLSKKFKCPVLHLSEKLSK